MRSNGIVALTFLGLAGLAVGAATAADHPDLPPSHSVKPELYATGFEFAEGPALDRAGNLYVVNYRNNGTIGRIGADGTAGVFCNLREAAPVARAKPQANGLKIDRQGRLVASDAGAGRLLRIAADGKRVEALVESWEGKHFDAINDVALDLAGNIYFSDPGNSNAEKPTGSVYRYDMRTAKVTRLDTGLAYPNGLAVTPDQKRLCLGESARYRLNIYDLTPDGAAVNRRVLIEFPREDQGNIRGGKFEPDGMVFDARGRLYVGMWVGGVINVVEVPSGRLIRQYDAGGAQATNCHFHGPYLYTTVAAKEAVFRLKLGVQGFDYSAGP